MLFLPRPGSWGTDTEKVDVCIPQGLRFLPEKCDEKTEGKKVQDIGNIFIEIMNHRI